jgi:hypothetical protein
VLAANELLMQSTTGNMQLDARWRLGFYWTFAEVGNSAAWFPSLQHSEPTQEPNLDHMYIHN